MFHLRSLRILLGTVMLAGSQVCASAEIADDIVVTHAEGGRLIMALGGSFGNANYNETNDSAFAVSLFGELRFNPNLAVNLGWADFGKASKNRASSEVDTTYVALMGRMPVRRELALYGRIGFDNWNLDYKAAGTTSSDSNTDLFYGFGLDYDPISPAPLVIRFGLDFFPMEAEIGPTTTINEDISVFNVGVMFKF